MRKSSGPEIEPYETPVKIFLNVEISFSISTNCFLPFRYYMNQSFATPLIPKCSSFLVSIS